MTTPLTEAELDALEQNYRGETMYDEQALRLIAKLRAARAPLPQDPGQGDLVERLKAVEPFRNIYGEMRVSCDASLLEEAALALSQPRDVPEGFVLAPLEPTDAMADAGAHCNSEWLNDGAPIGERRYREPAMAVWRTMLRTSRGEDTNFGWKEPALSARPTPGVSK